MKPAVHCGFESLQRSARCGLALVVLAALLAALFLTGCGSETTGPASTEPIGRLVDFSGCKSADLVGAAPIGSSRDCIEYSYRLRTLHLKHVNAAFNCCPEFDANVTVSGDTIFVVERETVGGCHCLCLYDLDYRVWGLPLGAYRVIVSQEYLLEGDAPLEFTMDLRASKTGAHCVARDHYPWAE